MDQTEIYKNLELQTQSNIQYLKINDPAFYYSIEGVYKLLKNAPIPTKNNLLQGPRIEISTDENMQLANEFLMMCDPTYGQAFYNDYHQEKIKVLPTSDSCCQVDIKNKTYQLIINKTNTLKEALDMVHEYFHVLNLNIDKIPFVRQSFTETISITAELLFMDFLRNKNLSEYELQLLKSERIDSYRINIGYLQYVLPIYCDLIKKDRLPADYYESQADYYKTKGIEKNKFLTIAYQLSNKPNSLAAIECYKYAMGYAYASYFHQFDATVKNLVHANESLKVGDIDTVLMTLVPNDIELEELGKTIKKEIPPFVYQKK